MIKEQNKIRAYMQNRKKGKKKERKKESVYENGSFKQVPESISSYKRSKSLILTGFYLLKALLIEIRINNLFKKEVS